MDDTTVGSRSDTGPMRPQGRVRDNPDVWSARLTRDVGQHLRHWRKLQRLSIRRLSDRTADIGQRVAPAVLTNLEHGRRDFVSVAEMLLIAAALNVPPVLLIAPVGRKDEMEALPEANSTPWRVRGWLMGAVPPPYEGFDLRQWNEATTAIKLYDTHRLLVRSYRDSVHRLKELDDDRMDVYPGRQWPQEALEQRRRVRRVLLGQVAAYLDQLRSHRRQIAELEFRLPALAPEVGADLAEAPVASQHEGELP